MEDLLYAKYFLYHFLKKSLYVSGNNSKDNENTGTVLHCPVCRGPLTLGLLCPLFSKEAGRGHHAWVTGVAGGASLDRDEAPHPRHRALVFPVPSAALCPHPCSPRCTAVVPSGGQMPQ